MLYLLLYVACNSEDKLAEPSSEGRFVVDEDGDGFLSDEDCADDNDQVNPSAEEICDDIDNNCSGQIDEGVLIVFYADSDQDGHGNPNIEIQACSVPDGYVSSGDDCDDTISAVHPSAEELCDELDNDCDSEIDEGVEQDFYADQDGDGFGNDQEIIQGCEPGFGRVQASGDCNDEDPLINPIAAEICDEYDNNCNGEVDEDVQQTFYRDFDEDSFGDTSEAIQACDAVVGYVDNNSDCDDLESFVHPHMVEICDGFDNDCDGDTDELDAVDVVEYYVDLDGDGFGAGSAEVACALPESAALMDGDCDDSTVLANPAMIEICDEIDNNCDGNTDEDTAVDVQTWYLDSDADGFGDQASSIQACSASEGYVSNSDDCNDSSDLYSLITTWYLDADEDGYGGSTSVAQCEEPLGFILQSGDCNDDDVAVYTGAAEICDEVDNDCDGEIDQDDSDFDDSTLLTFYADEDGDGFGDDADVILACILPEGASDIGGDCNDDEQGISPDAEEVGYDGIDNDCSTETIDEQTDLLLHMDNEGDEFLDSSAYGWSVVPSGGVQQNNSMFKYGTGSGYFDGSDDRLEVEDVDWSFGYDDFTIDMWVWINHHSDMGLASTENPITNNDGWLFDLDLTGNSGAYGLRFKAGSSDVVKGSYGSGGSYPTQTWTHVAAVRSSGVFTVYLNGQSVGSTTSEVFIEDTEEPLRVGQRGTTGDWFNGYIDEVRIVKGQALWTQNFTPPGPIGTP